MIMTRSGLCALLGLMVAGSATSAVSTEWQKLGTEAEAAGDAAKAIALYRQVVAEQPQTVPAWMLLGRALRRSGQPNEARAAFDKILAINPSHPGALANLAVIEAQANRAEQANALIEKAVNAGLLPGQLDSLKELDSIRQTAAFKKHYALATKYANPCRSDANYGSFDFWVGEWDIYVAGQLIARNIITKEMNGCIIHERYQTVNGLIRGESVNYYDPIEAKWKQNWVSASGNVISYTGHSPKAGVMAMEGRSHSPGSPVQLQRVTWTKDEDGGLVQSVSFSNDQGKSWSAGFNGQYRRSGRPTITMYPDDKYPENAAVQPPSRPGS